MIAVCFFFMNSLAQAQTAPVAGGVVSSKEWKVKRGAEQEEEFIGDVRYRSRQAVLTADWALYKHKSQTWQAKGRVRVTDTLEGGDTLFASGEQAAFNQINEKGSLTGKQGVAFLRTPAQGEPDRGQAERLEWEGRNIAAAVGDVHVWGPRLEAWSDRADYNGVDGKLVLAGGRPVLLKLEGFDPRGSDWIGAIQGDVVTAFQSPRGLSADGSAKGWIDFKPVKGMPAQ